MSSYTVKPGIKSARKYYCVMLGDKVVRRFATEAQAIAEASKKNFQIEPKVKATLNGGKPPPHEWT